MGAISGFISLALLTSACRGPAGPRGLTNVQVAGQSGSAITGRYVLDGQEFTLNESLPFSIASKALSSIEIHKIDPSQGLSLAAQHDRSGWHYEGMVEAPPGVSGVRVDIANGVVLRRVCQ